MWKRKTGGHVVSLTHITTPAGQDGQSWADSDGDASSETDESEGSVCTSPDTAPSSHTSTTASSSRGGWSRMSRALTRVAIGFPWAVLLWLIVVAVPVGLTYRYDICFETVCECQSKISLFADVHLSPPAALPLSSTPAPLHHSLICCSIQVLPEPTANRSLASVV
jgi:hypothetical protein